MKNPNSLFCILVCMAATVTISCTLITDFEDYDGGSDKVLYSLEENVDDPVDVVLLNAKDALIELSLEDKLPTSENDSSTIEQLLSSVVTLTLKNNDGGATVNLTQGTLVTQQPEKPGEYRITTTAERNMINVQFFNQIQDGRSLNENGNYQVVVEIRENEFLQAESVVRDVTVTRQE